MKKEESKPQIVNLGVLNNAVMNLEKFMEPLNQIEKHLVIQQLTIRIQNQVRNIGIKDSIDSILPSWVKKQLFDKDKDEGMGT